MHFLDDDVAMLKSKGTKTPLKTTKRFKLCCIDCSALLELHKWQKHKKRATKESSHVVTCRWDSWVGHILLILLTHYLSEFSDIISPSKSFALTSTQITESDGTSWEIKVLCFWRRGYQKGLKTKGWVDSVATKNM